VVGRSLPADIIPRVQSAFEKAAQAFAVLASFSKRKEYDSTLLSLAIKTTAPAAPIISQDVQPTNNRASGDDRTGSSAVAADVDDLNLDDSTWRGSSRVA
jgi:hypothetical protein